MHILPWAPTDDYEISHGEVGWSMFHHEHHMVTMRFLMVKREEPYFTMSITWWPCDFSWWDGRSHVSSWASRGDHEIFMVKIEEPHFTMSITWQPWDFTWWGGMGHVSSWASHGDHEISHGEDGGVIFHHKNHMTTMRFLMVRWDESCFTMSITWWPWDFSVWRWISHISPRGSRDDHEISHGEVGWAMFHHEHHLVTMRFFLVKREELYFTMSITCDHEKFYGVLYQKIDW